jgi:hypothetical protein
MGKNQQDYKVNGVSFSKASISVGDEVTLSYKGVLLEKGSADIFLHFGYGDSWEEKELLQMKLEKGTYKAKLKMKHSGNLNFCFKDNVENWDNNADNNYSLNIEEEKAKKTKKESTSKTKAKVEKPDEATTKVATKTTTKSDVTKTPTPKTTAKSAVKTTKKN